MAYINIEIDLSEFDKSDIVDYIKKCKHINNARNNGFIADVKEAIGGIRRDEGRPNTSKVDQWKDELWPKIKEKYSLEELENILNS